MFLGRHGSNSDFTNIIHSVSSSVWSHMTSPHRAPVWSLRSISRQQAIRHFRSTMFEVSVSVFSPCTPVLNPCWSLMVVTDRQHQRNEAAQNQSYHLHLAQSFPSVPSCRSVAVAATPDLREDMDGGHVEEGAGREEHSDAGGVDV